MVRIFVTGGTFDNRYNELDGTLTFQETHLPEMLRLGRCRLDVSITTLMMIDSLNMTLTDRASDSRAVSAGRGESHRDHSRN
jgi:L-asparaginase